MARQRVASNKRKNSAPRRFPSRPAKNGTRPTIASFFCLIVLCGLLILSFSVSSLKHVHDNMRTLHQESMDKDDVHANVSTLQHESMSKDDVHANMSTLQQESMNKDAKHDSLLTGANSSSLEEEEEDPTAKKCIGIIAETRLQAPKSKTQKWKKNNWGSATKAHKKIWAELDCVNVLGLYDTKVFSYDDELPSGVYKSSLTETEQRELYKMTKAFVTHMERTGILFFPAFGSLLGLARNNIALLPWDDDIDFEMHDDGQLKEKISKGLKKPRGKLYTSAKATDVWELPGGWIMYHKTWGMPWKVHPPDKGYPNIDMNTFKIVNGKAGGKRFLTDEKQLENGHLHKFDKPASWFGDMNKTITVPFSAEVPEPITFHVPDNIEEVIIDDYGEEGLTQCQTSFNHNPFCARQAKGADTISCENAMANHLAKTAFPCTLLPARFHGRTLVNEPRYKGGEKG